MLMGIDSQFNSIEETDRRHVFDTWSYQGDDDPTQVVDSHGVYYVTADGNEYLDISSQLVCANLGYSADRVVDAISTAAAKTPYVNPHATTSARAKLGKRLADVTPGSLSKTFFSTSGTEANEAAIKMARLYTGKEKIMTRYRSYHGSTAGSIAASGHPMRAHSSGVNERATGFIKAPDAYAYGSSLDPMESLEYIEEMFELEHGTIAGVIVEPIVGNHGVIVPPDGYLARLKEIAHDHGALLIFDEVMTGFGRTGEWFGADHFGVTPDIMTMAKGLTGAYAPLGATIVSEEIAEYFDDNLLPHGHTYSGHPVACAAGLAAIETYEAENLIERASERGEYISEWLEKLAESHPSVGEARGVGMFHGIELTRREGEFAPFVTRDHWLKRGSSIVSEVTAAARERGVAVYGSYNGLVIAPPLVINKDEINSAFEAIDAALEVSDAAME